MGSIEDDFSIVRKVVLLDEELIHLSNGGFCFADHFEALTISKLDHDYHFNLILTVFFV